MEPSNTQPIREIRKDLTTFWNGTTSGKIKGVRCPAGVLIIIPSIDMPFENNSYFARGTFQHRVITRQSLASYDRARDSTHLYPRPYLSPAAIALCMEGDGDWYNHTGRDLHLVDLTGGKPPLTQWVLSGMTYPPTAPRSGDTAPGASPILVIVQR